MRRFSLWRGGAFAFDISCDRGRAAAARRRLCARAIRQDGFLFGRRCGARRPSGGSTGTNGITGHGRAPSGGRIFSCRREEALFRVPKRRCAKERIISEKKRGHNAAGSRKSGFRMRGLVHKSGCGRDRARGTIRSETTEIHNNVL